MGRRERLHQAQRNLDAAAESLNDPPPASPAEHPEDSDAWMMWHTGDDRDELRGEARSSFQEILSATEARAQAARAEQLMQEERPPSGRPSWGLDQAPSYAARVGGLGLGAMARAR